MQNTSKSSSFSGTMLRDLRSSLFLSIILPVAGYFLMKRYVPSSEVVALSAASLFPLIGLLFGALRQRTLNILALVVLLGGGAGIAGTLLSGNEDFLLMSGSCVSGVLGLACLVSLGLQRPLLFYLARQFRAGRDPERLATFNASWQQPTTRFAHRLMTTVWGAALLADVLIRGLLVLTLSHALVIAIAPVSQTIVIVLTLLWMFAYARRVGKRTPPSIQ